MQSRSAPRPADAAPAVLVVKTQRNPLHHGASAVIRSPGRAGVPVHAVLEDRWSPAASSRLLMRRRPWGPDDGTPGRRVRHLLEVGAAIGHRPVLMTADDAGAILVAEHAEQLRAVFRLPDQPRALPRRLASKVGLAEVCRELRPALDGSPGGPRPAAAPAGAGAAARRARRAGVVRAGRRPPLSADGGPCRRGRGAAPAEVPGAGRADATSQRGGLT